MLHYWDSPNNGFGNGIIKGHLSGDLYSATETVALYLSRILQVQVVLVDAN